MNGKETWGATVKAKRPSTRVMQANTTAVARLARQGQVQPTRTAHPTMAYIMRLP